eukprot:812249-Amphidinium_carterae.1
MSSLPACLWLEEQLLPHAVYRLSVRAHASQRKSLGAGTWGHPGCKCHNQRVGTTNVLSLKKTPHMLPDFKFTMIWLVVRFEPNLS